MKTKKVMEHNIGVYTLGSLLCGWLLLNNLLGFNDYLFSTAVVMTWWVTRLIREKVELRLCYKKKNGDATSDEADDIAADPSVKETVRYKTEMTIVYVGSIAVCVILVLCFYRLQSSDTWFYTGWVRGARLAMLLVALCLWEIARLHLSDKASALWEKWKPYLLDKKETSDTPDTPDPADQP